MLSLSVDNAYDHVRSDALRIEMCLRFNHADQALNPHIESRGEVSIWKLGRRCERLGDIDVRPSPVESFIKKFIFPKPVVFVEAERFRYDVSQRIVRLDFDPAFKSLPPLKTARVPSDEPTDQSLFWFIELPDLIVGSGFYCLQSGAHVMSQIGSNPIREHECITVCRQKLSTHTGSLKSMSL